MSRIWACRNIRCFWVFPQKIIAKHRSLNCKKTWENNRYRWLNKNKCTDCDGKNVQKASTTHRCFIKNISIASPSKIDHRSSLVCTILCKVCPTSRGTVEWTRWWRCGLQLFTPPPNCCYHHMLNIVRNKGFVFIITLHSHCIHIQLLLSTSPNDIIFHFPSQRALKTLPIRMFE